MKRFISLLMSLILFVSMLSAESLTVFAEAKGPQVDIVTDYDAEEGTVDLEIILKALPAEKTLAALDFVMQYPKEKVTLDGNCTFDTSPFGGNGIGNHVAASGEIKFAFAGMSAITISSDVTIAKATFKVNNSALGNMEFKFTSYAYSYGDDTVGEGIGENPSSKKDVTIPIVTVFKSNIPLTGSVTTPIKNDTDASSLSASGVNVNIEWTPELEAGNKFAGNTQYKVKLTVTAAEGYQFGTGAGITLDGYTFTKDGDSFVATKTFDKTADKELTGISINESSIARPTAEPGAVTYNTLDLTATGTYDDDSSAAVSPTWELTGTVPTGVSLEGNTLKVANNVTAASVDVKATAGGKTTTKTISITKDTPAVGYLRVENGLASADVPTAAAGGTKTYDTAFTAQGYDQYGDTISAGTVTWSVADLEGNAVSGISVNTDGKLTVTKDASAGTVVVKATAGGKEATKNVTINKAERQATTVTVSDGVNTVAVPTVDENNGSRTTEAFTAEVKDQFDAVIEAPELTWSIEGGAPTGVSVGTDGKLTITSDAAATMTDLKVKATCGVASGTKAFSIMKTASAEHTVKIYKGSTDVTGTEQSMVIPKSGTNTETYTAKVFDQYGKEMTATLTWEITPTGAGVTVSGGTVSVATGATAQNYTLKASGTTKNAALTVKVAEKLPASVTLSNTTITYGQTYTPNPSVNVTGGSWSYSYTGTSLDGTYTGGTTAPTAAGTYTVTATYESATHYGSDTATLTINTKTLTISGVKATNRVYDGTTEVVLTGGNLVGNLDGANVGFTLGTGTMADKNVGTGKAVTTGIELTESKKANYTLTQPTDVTVNISKATLTVGAPASALTKEYDGTKTYTGDIYLTLTGLVSSDSTGTLKAAGGTYNSKDVDTASEVTLGTLTAANFSLDNYSYTLPKPAANITPKQVDVTISGTTGPVDYGTAFAHTASAALLAGDTATYTVKYNDGAKPVNAGTYTLTAEISNTNYEANAPFLGVTSFTIQKATPVVTTSVTKELRYNDTAVKTLTPADLTTVSGKFTVGTVTGDTTILGTVPSGTAVESISYALKSGLTAADKDKSATVSLTFVPTDTANYNEVTGITLTIQVIDKTPVTDITVTMDDITYGETLGDPTAKSDAFNTTSGTWEYTYEGTLSDGSDTAYVSTTTKPTQPGNYTVTAAYEDSTQKGSGSTTFTIKKKSLAVTGLSVPDKVYNGTATAQTTGTLALDGVINSDNVTAGTLAVTSAAFADEKVGTNKNVTLTLSGEIAGTDSWKYKPVTLAMLLKGNITLPTQPVAVGDDAKRLVIDTIENSCANGDYSTDLTDRYANADAIKTALLTEAKKTISDIGSNIAYYDAEVERYVVVEKLTRGLATGWHPTNEGATILFPYPAGTGKDDTFVVVHMKDDGTLETPAVTKGEYGVTVTVDSTSPFALAWRVKPASNNTGNTSDSSGSSSGSHSQPTATAAAGTGDTTNIVMWMLLALAGAAGIAGLLVYKKKKFVRK